MSRRPPTQAWLLGGLVLLAGALGTMYVVVACESLPGFLGKVAGDPHPRTTLGVVLLIFAAMLASAGAVSARRRTGAG